MFRSIDRSFQGKLPGKAGRWKVEQSGCQNKVRGCAAVDAQVPVVFQGCQAVTSRGLQRKMEGREALRFCCYNIKTLLKIWRLSQVLDW